MDARGRLGQYALVILCCLGLVGCRPDGKTSAVNAEEHIKAVQAFTTEVKGLKEKTGRLSENVGELGERLETTGKAVDGSVECLNREITSLGKEVRRLRLGIEDPNGAGRIKEDSPPSLMSRIKLLLTRAGFNVAVLIALLALFVSLRNLRITSTRYSLVNIMAQIPRELLDETKIKPTKGSMPQDDTNAMETLGCLNMISKLFMYSAINVSILRTFEPSILRVFQNEYIGRVYRQKYENLHDDQTIAEPPHINLLLVRRILMIINPILNFHKDRKGLLSRCISVLSYHLSLCLASVLRFKFRYLTSQQRMWDLSEQAANESQQTKETQTNE